MNYDYKKLASMSMIILQVYIFLEIICRNNIYLWDNRAQAFF